MTNLTALERARLKIAGEHGDLVVADGQLTITKRAPATSRITVGVDQLRGTVLVAPRVGGRGWLHVNAVGGSPTPAGELVAMTDPYAVRITGRTAGAAKRLARLVHEHLHARGMPSEPDQTTEPHDGRYSTAVMVTEVARDSDPPDEDTVVITNPDVERAGAQPASNGEGTAGRADAHARERDPARQLQQLSQLHTSGALTDEEFGRLCRRVLDGDHDVTNNGRRPTDGHSGRSIDGWSRWAEPRR